MQRAQDKIASMQARAGAIDELLASGALNDLSTPVDDIQKELDKVSATSQVDNELAALRAELGTSAPEAAALPSADAGAGGGAGAGAGAGAESAGAAGAGAGAAGSPEAAGTGGNGSGGTGGDGA